MESQSQMVARLRATFRSGVTVPEEFRRTQLTGLMSMIKDNEDQITDALHRDLAKVHGRVHGRATLIHAGSG